jgi:hypothetical protein
MSSAKMTSSMPTSQVRRAHHCAATRPNAARHRAPRGAADHAAGHGRHIHHHPQVAHCRLHNGRVRAKKIQGLLSDMDDSAPTTAQGEDRPLADGARADTQLPDRTPRLPPARIAPHHLQGPMELSHALPPGLQSPSRPAHAGHGREGMRRMHHTGNVTHNSRLSASVSPLANTPSSDTTDRETPPTKQASSAHISRASYKTSWTCMQPSTPHSRRHRTDLEALSTSQTAPWT